MKFDGKKILILGSNVLADEAVDYVQGEGGKAIVVDYLPVEQSPAKALADKHFEISTADTDLLIELCRSEHIDAVFSGISEFNLLQAMKISESIGKPFYFNQDQWDLIEKKDRFRNLCDKYEVPTPKTYFRGSIHEYDKIYKKSIEVPFVVKPTDCAASDGVSICQDINELGKAVNKALDASQCKRIIIEQFINGYEFTAHYTIYNGKAILSTIDNRYPVAIHEGSVTTIPIARIYPSLFIKPYIENVNEKMISLCESIGLKYAVIFIQGLYDGEDFYIFEAGLRPAAEAPCRFTERLTGQNHYKMMVESLLNGRSDYNIGLEDPYMKKKTCGVVSLAGIGGIVADIDGIETILSDIPGLLQYENRYPIGSRIPDGDSLRQLVLRFLLICKNRKEMVEHIETINNTIRFIDDSGRDLLVRMKPERILGYQ